MAGIETLIIERNSTVNNGPRAIAFDDEGLRICQNMQLGASLMENVLPGLGARYISAGRTFVTVSPHSNINGYPLISTFHQPDFENALFAGLHRFPSVQVCFQHTVETFEQSASGVAVQVRTPDGRLVGVECAYLLACNGGKHSLRHELNIPLTGITYPQQWLVIDFIDDEAIDTPPAALFFCDPERPAVSVTLPHGRRRWEFMLFAHETQEEVLEDERAQALLRSVHGSRQPQMVRCTTYTFHAALAERFSDGRVFLLGDAAHMMPPFGGQGMNSCLRDAHNLAWKLALVLRGLASPSILATYHEERHRHVASMIWFSSFLGQVVMTRSRPLATLRDRCFDLLNIVPYTRHYFSEIRIKPQPRIKKGVLLHCTHACRRYAGRLLPQPMVQTADGQRVLLDETLGNGFALLRLHTDPIQAFSACTAAIWQKVGVRFVCIQLTSSEGGTSAQYTVIKDIEQTLGAFFRFNTDLYLLVRPDRYILGACTSQDVERFAAALQHLLEH